jgi:hypothetical protein
MPQGLLIAVETAIPKEHPKALTGDEESYAFIA